jgi:hypothetical protein
VVATELASSFKFVVDNDNLDPTFQKHDHNEVLELKEISEFGRVWGKDDTKLLNSRLHSEWRKLDGRPTKDEMWSTHIFVPRILNWSSNWVDNSYRLDQQPNGIFSQTISIQKQFCHAVCCFRLDIMPHAVSGPKAFQKCVKATSVRHGIFLEKDRNHFFQESSPLHPIVLNLNGVSGLGASNKNDMAPARDRIIFNKLSSPSKIIGLDLLTQIRLLLEDGLGRFADEFVSLALPDDRATLAFHMGYSPKEGNKWTRKNGCSVTIPGL